MGCPGWGVGGAPRCTRLAIGPWGCGPRVQRTRRILSPPAPGSQCCCWRGSWLLGTRCSIWDCTVGFVPGGISIVPLLLDRWMESAYGRIIAVSSTVQTQDFLGSTSHHFRGGFGRLHFPGLTAFSSLAPPALHGRITSRWCFGDGSRPHLSIHTVSCDLGRRGGYSVETPASLEVVGLEGCVFGHYFLRIHLIAG